MLSRVHTAVIRGLNAVPVTVETDVTGGMPCFRVVGMPDQAVMESRERVRSALRNCGLDFPMRRITVNIAPADIRKRGTHLDLPIAVGILLSSGQLPPGEEIEPLCLMGELSLDGGIMPVPGVLPMIRMLKQKGFSRVVVPRKNAEEAALVPGIRIYGGDHLGQVAAHYRREKMMEPLAEITEEELLRRAAARTESDGMQPDFRDVRGQEAVKRAAMIAAAGGHSLLMTGSPATGKSMIAERIPSILPAMNYEEILETTMIWSGAGLLREDRPLMLHRPFRKPHQRISAAGLTGGGAVVRPGEITLASGGALMTAYYALDQGKRLYAVPGNITSRTSMGTNKLIQDSVQPVVSLDTPFEDLPVRKACYSEEKISGLGEDEQLVFRVLRDRGELMSDQISLLTGLSPMRVSQVITLLEMKGIAANYMGRTMLMDVNQ